MRRGRGTSLIEALVSLLVMALGLLSLVGVQARLRHGADLARQAAEADQLAVTELEALRGPLVRHRHPDTPAGLRTLDEIAASSRGIDLNGSHYELSSRIEDAPGAARWVWVSVEWLDRESDAATPHRVTHGALLRTEDPALIALAYLPPADPP